MSDHDSRSAVSGRYVSDEFADTHPDTTVSEGVPLGADGFGPMLVGETVHYVSYGTPDGEFASQCRAALITEVHPEFADIVSLAVLNPSGLFFDRDLHYVPAGLHRGGTWHTIGEHQ